MLAATGVVIRIRETGAEYGMHSQCADSFMAQLADAGFSPLSDDAPAVIIGPLFADTSGWTCALGACDED